MSQAADSRVKTVSGYRNGYPAANVTRASRQAETLSLSDAAWHWLAVQRYCSPQLQPAAAAEPPADHDEWALGTGLCRCGLSGWAVGTGP